jgi:hypothetical protein
MFMTSEWHSRPQVLAVSASCAAILLGFAACATAQVPPSGAEQQQLALLRQQVSVLEKRVTELERTKGSATKVDESAQAAKDSSGTKALEQRLAALEQAQAKKEATLGPDKATIVTAPFVVVDRGGKVVMRVQGEFTDKASRGVYVYGAGSDIAVGHLGLTKGGAGRLYVTSTKAPRPQIQAIAEESDTAATVAVFRADGNGFNSLEQQGLMIRNGEGKAIGTITSQSGTGYLALSDSGGNTMMDAGTLKSQKGYVRVNPYRASTSPQGDPSVLMGGKK